MKVSLLILILIAHKGKYIMQNKLFAAVLLCAISFNTLQASENNPYRIAQENIRQPRCIRVITEIPVDMAGFIPRQGYGYSNSCESKTAEILLDSSAKKSATEEAILQLITALTKNLKVVPTVDDTTSTSNNMEYLPDPDYGPTFGVIKGEDAAVKAAREEAAAKAKADKEAGYAAER